MTKVIQSGSQQGIDPMELARRLAQTRVEEIDILRNNLNTERAQLVQAIPGFTTGTTSTPTPTPAAVKHRKPMSEAHRQKLRAAHLARKQQAAGKGKAPKVMAAGG